MIFATSEPPTPDHPRACGANMAELNERVCERGSSPRVRGQRFDQQRHGPIGRIIPARAGPTRSPQGRPCSWADHPRACGANRTGPHDHFTLLGSSPRVRGQRRQAIHASRRRRIIPARAGPTSHPPSTCRCRTDHPRACGANLLEDLGGGGLRGSSPRVRGQRNVRMCVWTTVRIIPARAGPTERTLRRPQYDADHPRACGANTLLASAPVMAVGSSPRVRGQLALLNEGALDSRIIPARAGPTTWNRNGASSRTDHPRACGANSYTVASAYLRVGSSPRVRGQRWG